MAAKVRKIKKLRMVRVWWRDTNTRDGAWLSLKDCQRVHPVTCTSVGYLIAKTKDGVRLALNMMIVGKQQEVSTFVDIPLGCIIRIEKLKAR